MKIVVGLGNPEAKYDLTRHNVGFLVLERIASGINAHWQDKPKFKAFIAETNIDTEKTLLVKPTTFYNQTGESIRALVDFYKLTPACDVLVLHDELALPFGVLRTRLRGSDAGNNGIKSAIAHIGSEFARIRIGIANDFAPRMDKADFVLARFTAEEQADMTEISRHTLKFIKDFVHHEREFAPTSTQIQKDQP